IYTSVYTDSEPGRVFWGADEELSDGGSPRVIVYGYDGLPMLPVASPSPDYIPSLEEPQTPPAPQDEDEHEPTTFIYTSVYTDSEPGRVFWGADEELSDGGSPRVIVYGYDGLPMLPVASPSPDYIPSLEEPQTPPAPQDEDEHEPTTLDISSASSTVTYTSIYTDSELGRVFWEAEEELSDGGSPRVIVYGYDGLPILLVALPSPDYIPGPEEPQTPPAPQDEDEHEPIFI
nr:hypothetical protein [Tanacetum cinerariifolium]